MSITTSNVNMHIKNYMHKYCNNNSIVIYLYLRGCLDSCICDVLNLMRILKTAFCCEINSCVELTFKIYYLNLLFNTI